MRDFITSMVSVAFLVLISFWVISNPKDIDRQIMDFKNSIGGAP